MLSADDRIVPKRPVHPPHPPSTLSVEPLAQVKVLANKRNSCGDGGKARATGNLHDQVARSAKSNTTEKKERKRERKREENPVLVLHTRNYFQKSAGVVSKVALFLGA